MSRRRSQRRPVTVVKVENEEILTKNCYPSRLSEKQVSALEGYFQQNHYPDTELRKEISEMIDLEQKRVFIWFQNRRKKEKYGGRVKRIIGPRVYPCERPRENKELIRSKPIEVKESSKRKKEFKKTKKDRKKEKLESKEEDTYSHLPKWPITMNDYIPFQKEPFAKFYEEDAKDKDNDKDREVSKKSSKTKLRSKSKTNLKEDISFINSERLGELLRIIEDIRKDVLYVPMMDELYEGNHFDYVDAEFPSKEIMLLRSAKQLMEYNVFVENLKL